MPEAATATVDRDDDLAKLTYTQRGSGIFIVDVIDLLHLAEVVSRAETAELLHAAAHGGVRDSFGVGTGEATVLLGDFQVFDETVALLDSPG